ncbi:PREDICTED: forkhead box protein P3 [Nanorana parkeri]|uniref:forkhead box protein P3 n=1 Tax=Nanorana parkeri TaxID=125878 RepID=UPI0008540D51|nr:PREDICTED: forkhead box protein P3 [Nanorana parkeri]
MPSPQASKLTPASSAESDSQPDEKGKGQISQWNRRGAGVGSQMHQPHQHPYIMANPSASFSSTSYLRAMLHDSKQAVVIHPFTRDHASQSSVLHLAPSASSSSILNMQPTRLFPLVTKHKQHAAVQGMKPGSLGWVQHESSSGKNQEDDVNKKGTVPSYGQEHPKNIEHVRSNTTNDGQDKDGAEPVHPAQYSGGCKFPWCEKTLADHKHFLRHLYSDHHHLDDKTTVQCLIQHEVVHNLEEKLAMEKQRLHEMQSFMTGKHGTAHLSKQRERSLLLHQSHYSGVSNWPVLDLTVPLQEGLPDTVLALRRPLWEGGSVNIFHDMTNCIEYYKNNNVRPPFTYASLIRWAIQESPQKQLALNEIYQWFTRMFAFFRLNKVTWKGLYLGAVWMVDEAEFQRKRAVRGSR